MKNRFTHYYFLGIGGIGMSALARFLVQKGAIVAGYDKVRSSLCAELESEGIDIHYEDDFKSIADAFKNPDHACVVYTPAIPKTLNEYQEFTALAEKDSLKMLKRSQLLGEISKSMTCLAVAGTHGKTTTSAILAHLLHESGAKMTAILGGIVNKYKSNYIHTGDEVLVVEADEFDRSFMYLEPDFTGITSMDADHLDIYGDENEFLKTFHDFAKLTPQGQLYVNTSVGIDGRSVGIEGGSISAKNLRVDDGNYHFDLVIDDQEYVNFEMNLPGRHNVNNALLAISLAVAYGVDPEMLREPLKIFPGVERRFTYRFKSDDLVFIDDYAHHPTEIDAVHNALREMYPGEEITAVFQPHLFSRTRDFLDGFVQSLSKFDHLALLDIYPARELPIEGVTSKVLAKKINETRSNNSVSVIQKNQLEDFLKNRRGKIFLMIGAGDIGVEIVRLANQLITSHEA